MRVIGWGLIVGTLAGAVFMIPPLPSEQIDLIALAVNARVEGRDKIATVLERMVNH